MGVMGVVGSGGGMVTLAPAPSVLSCLTGTGETLGPEGAVTTKGAFSFLICEDLPAVTELDVADECAAECFKLSALGLRKTGCEVEEVEEPEVGSEFCFVRPGFRNGNMSSPELSD